MNFTRILENIELDITRECNFNCPSCLSFSNLYNKNLKSVMTLDEIYNIMKDFKLKNIHIHRLEILGGEPTLHPQFKDVCKFLRQYIDNNNIVDNVYLYTNHSNKLLVNWVELSTDFKIVDSEIRNKTVEELKALKVKGHYNLYAINKIEDLSNDVIYKCGGIEKCGLTIYKFNNEIRYAVCCYSAFIARLLQQEDKYSFKTLDQCLSLLDDRPNQLVQNICCHCFRAFLVKHNIDFEECKNYKKFDIVNNEFKDGYDYMLKHTEMFN